MNEKVKKELLKYQDKTYKEFVLKLTPNLEESEVIGVKLPVIRKIAKEIYKTNSIEDFLNKLPHETLEENILHGALLSLVYKDINQLLDALNRFLPYANNWVITDTINPKIFKKYPDLVYKEIKMWINSKDEYIIRFGIVSLIQAFLDNNFKPEILELVSHIKSDFYYVNMAIAWFYSTALIKQYEYTIKYFEDKKLDKWIHNKSIQKAIESYRISDDVKKYLRSLKC